MDLVDPGRCRSTWNGPRSTVRSSGPTRSRCRRTVKDVAADLNVNPETLRTWVRDADGRPVAAGASRAGVRRSESWPSRPKTPIADRSRSGRSLCRWSRIWSTASLGFRRVSSAERVKSKS
ncbi:transposase [Streptomyces atratus]|uniref:transposase n=1 Tax=Streptomyces atratus TaxID=1893 RepID=UPI0036AD94B8